MNAQLEAHLTAEIGQVIDDHIAPIFQPGARITALVRHPDMDDADAAVTSDTDAGVHAIVQRRFPGGAATAAAEIARLSAALDETLAQLEAERARNAEPVAWMLEWTCNGEERGQRLYDDERHCIFDAESDGGVVVPLLRGEPLTTTQVLATIPGAKR